MSSEREPVMYRGGASAVALRGTASALWGPAPPKDARPVARKTRVGVLMEALTCDPFLFDTLTSLAQDHRIELHLLLHEGAEEEGLAKVTDRLHRLGLRRFVGLVLFRCIVALERKAFSAYSRRVRRAFVQMDVRSEIFATCTRLEPIRGKRNAVEYSGADVEKVRRLGLDLILRGNARGIYKGTILSASRQGIISFHHGDNRWNRGQPPGFWEVVEKRPATGFIIQLLNEQLDGGKVLFRGEARTLGNYTQNTVNLLEVANPFMAKLIREYAQTGTLPEPQPSVPFAGEIRTYPDIPTTCRYLSRTALRYTRRAIERKVLGIRQRWSVAVVCSDWRDANLSKGVVVRNPPGRFLADPFVATREGDTVIFVEDFDFASGRGAISALRLLPAGRYELIPNVIEESFHLSFPYLFEYAGELYMVPESQAALGIRLYRCLRFPDRWQYEHDLISDVHAVDSMVFEHAGKWWMLTNIDAGKSGDHAQMYAFSTDDPLSVNWRAHPKNPVLSSAEHGRNGGLLRDERGGYYRVRQRYGFDRYGIASSVARIVRLDENGYAEEPYCTIEPTFRRGLAGTHHMHSNGRITVFDFDRDERVRTTRQVR